MSSFTADKRYVFSEDSSRNVPEKRDVSKTKDVFTCPDETDSLDISEESGSGDRRDSLKEIPPAESLRTMYRRSTETGIMGVAMRNVLHFGNVLNYLDNADVFEDVIKTEDFEDIEGDASFSQCVANIVNLVVGLGINSLPFAIASSGWVGGSLSLLAVTFFCWKSAIFIARGLNGDIRPAKTFTKSPFEAALNPRKTSDPRFGAPSVSYPDFLRKAFGETGAIIGTLMLCFELFCGMVAYLMSGGQNLALLFENTPREILVLALGGVSLIPTVLLKTPRLLSYLGFVGTSVTTSLVLTLLALVFSQGDISELVADQEGDPSEDNNLHPIFIASGIPTTLAICSFSFCGHAFLPSIYTSMKTPQDFERVIDVSFGIIFCVYLTFGLSGYYLFGSLVADQVTMTLSIYGSPVGLMKTLTGVVGVMPLLKVTPILFPVTDGLIVLLKPYLCTKNHVFWKKHFTPFIKIGITLLACLLACLVSSFALLASLTGSVFTMLVSVILPAAAHWTRFRSELSWAKTFVTAGVVAFGATIAVLGTASAIVNLA